MHEIEEITELARDSRWRGVPSGPHVSRSGRNPYCGDVITLHFEVDGDHILDIRFDGSGCLISQGCAALLCEQSAGKMRKELVSQSAVTLLDFDYTQLSPHRQVCALLGYDILQRKLNELLREGNESTWKEHD